MSTGTYTDLTGRVFGSVVVLRRVGSKIYQCKSGRVSHVLWLCRCDGGGRKCKGEFITKTNHLLREGLHSCGCLKSYKDSSPTTYLFGSYKGKAKKVQREFILTKEQFAGLIISNCFYCGRAPQQRLTSVLPTHSEFRYNGIDRIDSSRGYTQDNVVPCCKTCNEMKSDRSQQEFLEQIRTIFHFQYRKKFIIAAA